MEKWYVIQTRPRWEKKVVDCLARQGIECYCPVKKIKRRWSDRIKTLEEPLFRSCVFVKILPDQKTTVRLTEGVVNFVYDNGKPAQVKSKEIEHLRKLLPVLVLTASGGEELYQQHSSFFNYLTGLQAWLVSCMQRPRFV